MQTAEAATSDSIGKILNTATEDAASKAGLLINSTPAPTYTSDNLNLFTQLNVIRKNAGAGLLVQNNALDIAAANHVNYIIKNNLISGTYLTTPVSGVLGGHYEDSTLTGFTGIDPRTRATFAGYSATANNVSELDSFGSSSGALCAASIENSVYHLIELISPFIDIGVAFNAGNGSGQLCDLELGISTASGQYPPSGSWSFYPANGQTGVPPKFYNQAESPVPASDLLNGVGHPIVMSLYNQTNTSLAAADIVLTTFTLTATAGSTPVMTRVLAQSGVGGSGLTIDSNIPAPGVLVLLPTSPLSANTSYTVTFSSKVKNTVVSKSWSFTTGS